jgi:N-methylhydantoinase B
MPGSGGYGPAVRRDPARVAEDVRQGKLSIAHAARHYGVCCDAGGKVDAEATRRLRAAMAETTEEA